MGSLAEGGDSFDPSQFKLQPDGTFRISIRGMAAMAGVDQSGLTRSLKSAEDENPLPCARSLLVQGFCPEDVSTWGETGGIPEDAAPFILEHYGITSTNPSQQARKVLLSFSRVGINVFLKEKLGLLGRKSATPLLPESLAVGLESAKAIASAVSYVGGNGQFSMAKSLTVLAKQNPDQSKMLYESQRLLCPAIDEFVNPTELLNELTVVFGESRIREIAKAAKAGNWMKKADPRHLVNVLLERAGLQERGGKRRDQASWIPTQSGSKLSREETRPDVHEGEAWVPQLLWLKSDTVRELAEFIKQSFSVKNAAA